MACEKVPRPPELWLPATFHELPDSLVTKYVNDYRCGLRARMLFPKVMEELDFMSWCCGSFTPSYIRDYAAISSEERAKRFREWLATLRGPRR